MDAKTEIRAGEPVVAPARGVDLPVRARTFGLNSRGLFRDAADWDAVGLTLKTSMRRRLHRLSPRSKYQRRAHGGSRGR